MMLKFYNSLSRKKEKFKPLKKGRVGFYACGPTVYWYAHIGNLRTYIFEDILKRVLEYNGYKVRHVMNITDVGHLTSDTDTGEDKLEKGAKREKKTVWQVADFYTKAFKKDIKLLNIKEPNIWVKATETIKEQINLIKILEKKRFTYKISDGIYFDSKKLKTYGRLWPKKMKILPGARVEMVSGKKNPTDFALWKFTPPGVKRQMEWDSPRGKGFPGWHTECVVMSKKYLGIPFDIHCGGIDHILIHHTNEIAQAEAAFGKILANYWLHGEFLLVNGEKMAKSKENIYILEDLIKRGFNPLSFRYLSLTCHYRAKLNFTWESIKAADISLKKMYDKIRYLLETKVNEANASPPAEASLRGSSVDEKIKSESKKKEGEEDKSSSSRFAYARVYKKKFLMFINNDLNMPKALALTWKVIDDKSLKDKEKYKILLDFDKVLGLNLDKVRKLVTPKEIKDLLSLREKYRLGKNWKLADEIRKKIEKMGYQIEDTKEGPKIKKIRK